MSERTTWPGAFRPRAGVLLVALVSASGVPGMAWAQATNSEILRNTMVVPALEPALQAPAEAADSAAPAPPADGEGLNFRRTLPSAVLITVGLLSFGEEGFLGRQSIRDWSQSIREWKSESLPDFDDHLDDFAQLAPGVLALGLNLFGVKGAHSLGRATVTYATSMAVMSLAVQTMKGLTDVERPDGSDNGSFPSGHTAASFASARFLAREYGDVSHLYSLGGYGLAALTGVNRVLNDQHWVSDVLVGAGIGLLSADIAYAIMDEIYGQRGVTPPRPDRGPEPAANPSFLDFRFGYAGYAGDADDPQGPFHIGSGWTAGFEAAWFPWRNAGIGAESSVVSFPNSTGALTVDDPELSNSVDELVSQPLGTRSIYVGPFFDIALSDRWALTGKATAGLAIGASGLISARISGGAPDVPLLQFDASDAFGLAIGAGVRGMVGRRIGLRLFGEWSASRPDYEIRAVTGVNDDGSLAVGDVADRTGVDFSYFAVGASVSALVW